MSIFEHEVDITKSIIKIEYLKSGILSGVARIFKNMANGINKELNDEITEELADIILMSYFLGRRIGIDYKDIDMMIESNVFNESDFGDKNRLCSEDIEEYAEYLKKVE